MSVVPQDFAIHAQLFCCCTKKLPAAEEKPVITSGKSKTTVAICDIVGHIRVILPNQCPAFISLHHSVSGLCVRLWDVWLRDTRVCLSYTV